MPKFPSCLNSEIRVADLLELYQNNKYGRFIFLCYGVSHLLNEKFKMCGEWNGDLNTFGDAYYCISSHYGEIALSRQINAQVFNFMEKLGMAVDREKNVTLGDFFLDNSGCELAWNGVEPFTVPHWSNDFRSKLLEYIIGMDPNAVFSIDLHR